MPRDDLFSSYEEGEHNVGEHRVVCVCASCSQSALARVFFDEDELCEAALTCHLGLGCGSFTVLG